MNRIPLNIICVLLATSLGGQPNTLATAIDQSEIQTQVRNYLRDVTEINLDVKSEVTVSDTDGGAAKERRSSHRLTYEAGSTQKKSADAQTTGTAKVGDWETHADAGLFATAYVFLPDQGGNGYYHSAPKRVADSVVVEYGSRERCSAWRKSWLGWHGFKFKEWCGNGTLRVSDDGVPVEASFSAAQLGPDLRSSDVPSYTYTIKFQRLSLPNSAKPFVVPRDVTLVVTYKNHRVVVHNLYSATLSPQE